MNWRVWRANSDNGVTPRGWSTTFLIRKYPSPQLSEIFFYTHPTPLSLPGLKIVFHIFDSGKGDRREFQ